MKRTAQRLAMLSALLATLAPASASDIWVQNSNVSEGAFAARFSVASGCASSAHAVVPGPLTGGTFEGCSSLVSDASVTSGSVAFRAGDRIELGDGFSVVDGASLSATIQPSLFPDAYLQDDTPSSETVYAARFYVDSTQLSLGAADRFYHFVALSGTGAAQIGVGLKWNPVNGGEHRLFVEALEDSGAIRSTEGLTELVLPAGWHWIEVGWSRASGPGANNGSLYLCIDDLTTGCASLANLDDDQGSVDTVRVGAIDVPNGSFGRLDVDDFESRRSLSIGPAAPLVSRPGELEASDGQFTIEDESDSTKDFLGEIRLSPRGLEPSALPAPDLIFADGFETGNFGAWSDARWIDAPAIVSVHPSNGLASVAVDVRVAGSGFEAGTTVFVGGIEVTCNTFDAASIDCVFPANSSVPERLDVTVETPGIEPDTLINAFTYTGVLFDSGPAFFCNVQFPPTLATGAGQATDPIFGQIYVSGLTDSSNSPVDLNGEVGVGDDGSDPAAVNWDWSPTEPNLGFDFSQNNDEHVGTLQVEAAGTFDYAYRFSSDDGLNFYYCDVNGSDDGYAVANAGHLVVNP